MPVIGEKAFKNILIGAGKLPGISRNGHQGPLTPNLQEVLDRPLSVETLVVIMIFSAYVAKLAEITTGASILKHEDKQLKKVEYDYWAKCYPEETIDSKPWSIHFNPFVPALETGTDHIVHCIFINTCINNLNTFSLFSRFRLWKILSGQKED